MANSRVYEKERERKQTDRRDKKEWRTRQLVPSFTQLNEQRTDAGHRLILINGDW